MERFSSQSTRFLDDGRLMEASNLLWTIFFSFFIQNGAIIENKTKTKSRGKFSLSDKFIFKCSFARLSLLVLLLAVAKAMKRMRWFPSSDLSLCYETPEPTRIKKYLMKMLNMNTNDNREKGREWKCFFRDKNM